MPETPQFLTVLDIDDVQARTIPTLVEYSNRVWNTMLGVADFQDNFREMWGVERAEASRRWLEFCAGQLALLRPMERAVEVVEGLPEHVELQSLTSRRVSQRGVTEWWERQYFPRISAVHFASVDWESDPRAHLRTKTSDLCRLGRPVDVWVDNEPKHALGGAAVCEAVVLFDAYNRCNDVALPPNVTRLTNWPTLGEFIEERAEEKLRQAA
jgi:hypothetical protein